MVLKVLPNTSATGNWIDVGGSQGIDTTHAGLEEEVWRLVRTGSENDFLPCLDLNDLL
jgi:hypothetical protein